MKRKRELVALLLLSYGCHVTVYVMGASSRCGRLVCSVCLWYFLIILTYFLIKSKVKLWSILFCVTTCNHTVSDLILRIVKPRLIFPCVTQCNHNRNYIKYSQANAHIFWCNTCNLILAHMKYNQIKIPIFLCNTCSHIWVHITYRQAEALSFRITPCNQIWAHTKYSQVKGHMFLCNRVQSNLSSY